MEAQVPAECAGQIRSGLKGHTGHWQPQLSLILKRFGSCRRHFLILDYGGIQWHTSFLWNKSFYCRVLWLSSCKGLVIDICGDWPTVCSSSLRYLWTDQSLRCKVEPTSRWREIILGALDGFSKTKLKRPPQIRDDHDVTPASVLPKVDLLNHCSEGGKVKIEHAPTARRKGTPGSSPWGLHLSPSGVPSHYKSRLLLTTF